MRRLSLLAAGAAVAAALGGCQQTVMLGNGGGADGASGSDGSSIACAGAPSGIALHSPDLIVALVRSSSMQALFDGGTSRIGAAEGALSNLIDTYQSSVRFGYENVPGID